jgi:hypothetical protein
MTSCTDHELLKDIGARFRTVTHEHSIAISQISQHRHCTSPKKPNPGQDRILWAIEIKERWIQSFISELLFVIVAVDI